MRPVRSRPMRKTRINRKRSGRTKTFHLRKQIERDPLDHAVSLIETVCLLAGSEHLVPNDASGDVADGLRTAIQTKDTPALFDWLVDAFSYQGISDHAAKTYMDRHGRITWAAIAKQLNADVGCPK